MQDLSLHILDVAENSIRAGSRTIEIALDEDPARDLLTLTIADDGMGMGERERRAALDPFFTTKPGKRVGLGLSLLAQAAAQAGGTMTLESEKDAGTIVTATFRLSHVDRKPLGDVDQTLTCLRAAHPEIVFRFRHAVVG